MTDFYFQMVQKKMLSARCFHGSQLVLVNSNQKSQIKILPFKQPFWKNSALDMKSKSKFDADLDLFIFDQCLTKQQRLFPLVKYWLTLFSSQVCLAPPQIAIDTFYGEFGSNAD